MLQPVLDAHAFVLHCGHALTRVRCAHLDPLLQQGALAVRELLLRRHLKIGIGVTDRGDQAALVRLAGHKGRS